MARKTNKGQIMAKTSREAGITYTKDLQSLKSRSLNNEFIVVGDMEDPYTKG